MHNQDAMPLAQGGCRFYPSFGKLVVIAPPPVVKMRPYLYGLLDSSDPSYKLSTSTLPTTQVVHVSLATPALPCPPCPQIRWVTHFTAFNPLMLSCHNTNMSVSAVLDSVVFSTFSGRYRLPKLRPNLRHSSTGGIALAHTLTD
jgi:hypothetical protein